MIDIKLLEYLESYLTENRKNRFRKVLSQRTKHFTIATEDVYQLHNTSAVMRSCDVFGLQDLHVVEARLGKKMDREIAMGAQKWVDIHRYSETQTCIDTLKAQGYRIVATTPHENSQYLQFSNLSKDSTGAPVVIAHTLIVVIGTCIVRPRQDKLSYLHVSQSPSVVHHPSRFTLKAIACLDVALAILPSGIVTKDTGSGEGHLVKGRVRQIAR